MKNPTELMRAILTNKKAQEIIDYVSPIYGKSYVALWIYEAIGSVLDQVSEISDQLRYETNPATANLLLSYWEEQYGIPSNPNLTVEQRRQKIISKIESRTACNPKVLASAVSAALNGAPVEIMENVAQNTFTVNIRTPVNDMSPVNPVVDRMKPAHLIYLIQVALQIQVLEDIKIATAVTHGTQYAVTVNASENPIGVYQVNTKLVVLFGPTVTQTGSNITIS